MESHELLREVFQKVSPKQAAAEMGLSLSMIYKWAEPPDQLQRRSPIRWIVSPSWLAAAATTGSSNGFVTMPADFLSATPTPTSRIPFTWFPP